MNTFLTRLTIGKPIIELNDSQKKEILELNKKVKNKIYITEEVNCPVCKKNERNVLGEYDRYGIYYKSNHCLSCGIIYTSPRLNQDSYFKFYDTEYRKIYTSLNYAISKKDFFDDQKYRGNEILKIIRNKHKKFKISSVLEVGCGMGGILEPFKKKGCKVKGIDLGSEYIEYGKSKGLDLSIGTIDIIDERFDFIIYSHVLEHLTDLGSELIKIKERLNKNGLLYIEVPGILNLKKYRWDIGRYFQNAHTYHFSLLTLKNVLSKNGFKLLYGNEKVESLFVIDDDLEAEEISNDYLRIIKYLEKAESRRKIWWFSERGIIVLLKKMNLYKSIKKGYLFFLKENNLVIFTLLKLKKK